MRFRNQSDREVLRLPMSPMIDIIFLLLIFFVMTFQIVPLEGDLSINAPPGQGSSSHVPSLDLTLRLRLVATVDGGLADIRLDDRSLGTDFDALRNSLISTGMSDSDVRVEIKADEHLQYAHTIDAVTAVTGFIDPQTGSKVKLAEKVTFVR